MPLRVFSNSEAECMLCRVKTSRVIVNFWEIGGAG